MPINTKMLITNFPTIAKLICGHVTTKINRVSMNYRVRCLTTQLAPPITQSSGDQSRKPSYLCNSVKKPLVYRTVGQELEHAVAEYGSSQAIVSCHEGKSHTYRSLLNDVDRLAAGFLKLGLQQGDYVAIWAPNNLHWVLTMLAAARAGLISVGINPYFQAPEVEYCLKKVHIKAIVAPETFKTQNFYEMLCSICPELADSQPGHLKSSKFPHLKAIIIDSKSKLHGALRFEEVLDLGDDVQAASVICRLQKNISPDAAVNVQFTSGTTGQPKAPILSHYGVVNNGIHVSIRNQLKNERICVQVPLFHVFGVVVTTMAAISSGACLVLPSAGFHPESSLRAIVDEECTVIHGTPTMYVDLIAKQKELRLPIKSAKMAVTGGAPCSPQLFMDIKNVLGLKHVRTVYGMTESTAITFQSRPGDSMDQILNTVGHITDHIEAKVIDANGITVPFGQHGELCVRGYSIMLGYYADEKITKEAIGADRWLRTGDQFVLQEDGYGRIVGRLKEMIIRGGENIFPKEIEDVLNTHPQILEAHVIGVPDVRMGEELCAFVRLQDGVENISRQTLKEFCKGKLAHFKVPRYVIPTYSFPKTTSGKIQKFKLQELFQKYTF